MAGNPFQFTRAGERATGVFPITWNGVTFQFTRAGERATNGGRTPGHPRRFNSRALGSARHNALWISDRNRRFNSRALGSARQPSFISSSLWDLFQFTRAGERATLAPDTQSTPSPVSIHARWGARDRSSGGASRCWDVSIHARWGARDNRRKNALAAVRRFQFTRAGERATARRRKPGARRNCFNSRALGSARLGEWRILGCKIVFQFTRAGERATQRGGGHPPHDRVSIHARWGARDLLYNPMTPWDKCFNSRALGSARLAVSGRVGGEKCFNSRALGSARHRVHELLPRQGVVSIHARWGARD